MACVKVDYGIIARRIRGGVDVFLLAGIHRHGTLAATYVALSDDFQKAVRHRRFTSFARSVRAETDGTGLHIRPGIVWNRFPLCELQ